MSSGYKETTDAQMAALAALTTDEVMSVYSGKDGKCCCGCAGKHSYNSKHREAGTNRAGYEVTVNDAMVTKALKLVQAATKENVMVGDNHYATVVGSRLYIVYPLASA